MVRELIAVAALRSDRITSDTDASHAYHDGKHLVIKRLFMNHLFMRALSAGQVD
jgi:hypothetical protein